MGSFIYLFTLIFFFFKGAWCSAITPNAIHISNISLIFQIYTLHIVDWLKFREYPPHPPARSFGSLFKVSFIRMCEQELANVLITT